MNITLFGGSFNPPHLGHQIVLNQALELKLIPKLDQIWLLIENQHSFDKSLSPAKHRLNMTKHLLNGKIKLQTCCLDQNLSGNTIEHLDYLEKTYPKHHFSFLLGSDNLTTFHKWPQHQTLLKKIPFYIYPRANHPFKPLMPNMHPLTHQKQIITNISSTMIRNRIKKHQPVQHLLPPKIHQYIQKNKLFA